ncbi:plasminogen [Erpetoichthys calabaricus]|uniref:Plasminogen n=1 Tax=Erpetoichthys calabaricus TaxID=27687 RepID=A0A8C4RK29_ERPCA|nr:plasminogen [Erpetoichthys calabaricus]
MVSSRAAVLLFTWLYSVKAGPLDGYLRTEGAWIKPILKNSYVTSSDVLCADKCDSETRFTCRSFVYIQKGQECITFTDTSKTTPVQRTMDAVLYEKKLYLQECKTNNGFDYRGTMSKTASGKTCQPWASTTPHKPNITPATHPKADLVSNYCRNPDNDPNSPWCYTTDPATRWEHCSIPDCNEECIYCSGEDYRGKVSKTENGYECQRWDSQFPHTHGYLPNILPDKYLEENYCRNPDGEPRPWCFTTNPNKRWELCALPRCTSRPPEITPEVSCITGEGNAYRGTIAVTVNGKTCQAWNAQSPHKHSRTPENYPCQALENNYCRNPDGARMPWCYTTDSNTRWENCDIPKCNAEAEAEIAPPAASQDCYEDNGSGYRGFISETVSGKKCQAWASSTPHAHNKTPQNFPNADLKKNFCRNPDNDRSPWCYTIDPSVRWEYCKIDKCNIPDVSVKPSVAVPRPQKPEPTIPPVVVKPENIKDCLDGNGADYRGSVSITASGVTCQTWASNTPHVHSSFNPSTHPDKGLDANYCRNPDGDVNGPWCYTTDPAKKWDYCQIPQCDSQECGNPAVKPRRCFGRIVGGCISNPHSWPWQASLRTSFHIHFCGGTLIDPQWILTAAHCLERSTRPSAYKVYLGIQTEKALEDTKQVFDVEKLVLGPNGVDIALIKLSRPAIINKAVLPACLPKKDYMVPTGTECYVTGWGETKGTGGDGFLKETGFPVIENKVCNRPEYLAGRVKSYEMCAGTIEGGTDSCQGDSGGPLVCNMNTAFVLQGVTSWGIGCANAMKPGVYVRVSNFVDWIDATIKKN